MDLLFLGSFRPRRRYCSVAFALVILGSMLQPSLVNGMGLRSRGCRGIQADPQSDLALLATTSRPGTVFCISKGIHRLAAAVVPKEGQEFLGVKGAVIDGGGVTRNAFFGKASNVRIKNLEIRNFNTPLREGTIEARASTGWVIARNDVHDNGGIGVFTGSSSIVRMNHVHHQDQLGLAGGGQGSLIARNEIDHNNTGDNNWYWEAGGTKFVNTTNLTVRRNFVHDNVGPGLWTDIDNVGTLYDSNTVINNVGPGIFHEISFRATIKNNVVRRNGLDLESIWWGAAGILVSASSNVEVSENHVSNNGGGIGMIQTDRGYSPRFDTEYRLDDVWIHDNTVAMTRGTTGLVTNVGNGPFDRNINFDHNQYRIDDFDRLHYSWRMGDCSAERWKDYGQDAGSTFDGLKN